MTWVDVVLWSVLMAMLAAAAVLFWATYELRQQDARWRRWADEAKALQQQERREWLDWLTRYDPENAERLRRRLQGWPL